MIHKLIPPELRDAADLQDTDAKICEKVFW